MTILVELNYTSSVTSPTQSVYFGINSFNVTGSTWADGRLMSPFKHKTSIKSWVQSGTSQTTIGDVKLANGDGGLDYLLDKIGNIKVFRYDGTGGLGTEIAYAKVDKIVASGEEYILIKLKNPLDELSVPLQTNTFPASETSDTGSGTVTYYGVEGQTRPLGLGTANLIKPFLADRSNNEYHCHDSVIFNLNNVYDDGIAVTFTQHTKGFTLASDPSGVITADGALGETSGGAATPRIDFLIPEIMDRISFTNYSSSDISSIRTNYSDPRFGYFQSAGTNQTALFVLNWVMDSIMGYMYADPDGEIRFGVWDNPKGTADDDINITNIIGGINIFSDEAPNITSKFGGVRNWYVYNQDDIAFGAPSQNKINFATNHQYIASGSSSLAYEDKEQALDSLLISTSNVDTVADRVTDIYSTRRNFYAFDSNKDASIGDTIELTYPRFGLESGKNLVVVGREIDFINNTYRLTLWG